MALTAAQLNTIYQNVLFRNVDQGGIQFFANRTDISDAQVRQQIELSSEASSFVSPIVRLYQEVLGRVPDQGGLNFFQAQLRGGVSLSSVAQQLISSQEFTAKTTATSGVVDATDLTNTNQLVTDAFSAILGRTPGASEFSFFQGQSAAQILAGVAGSSEAAATNAANVVTFLDSVAQGSYPTGSLGNQAGGANGGTNAGQTFVLTTALDSLTGTAGNDSFTGTVAANGANPGSTFNVGDSINGGAGTDKLTIFADAALPAATVTAVEQIYVQNSVALTAAGSEVNANNFSGATQFWSQNAGANVKFINLNTAQTAGISGTVVDAATVEFVYSNVGGTADTASLALANAKLTGASTVTIAGIETLNVTGSGTVVGLTTADTKTINIAATGTTSITEATNSTTLTKIDASASTGNVTFDLSSQLAANNVATTFIGGSGNDTFKLVAANLTTADSINGGSGTDTVSIGGGDYRAAANDTLKGINALTSIEQLEFTGGTAAQVNGDTFTNSTITKLIFNTSGATNDVIELAGARQYAVGALNAGDLTITQRAGATTLNLSLEGADADNGAAASVGTVTSSGATTINLSSSGVAGQPTNEITTALAAASNTTVNITGSQDLSIAGTTVSGNPGLNAAGINYNAASFTGKLVLTGSGSIDTIVAGSGGSTIAGGAGADVVTAGAGTDKFVFDGTAGANTSGAVFGQADVINSFAVGTDKLAFTNVTDVVSAQQGAVQTAVTGLAAGSTDAQIATAMATANTTNLGVSVATYNGNTYVLYETTGASTGVAADDVFIKLVGVSSGVTFANSVVAS